MINFSNTAARELLELEKLHYCADDLLSVKTLLHLIQSLFCAKFLCEIRSICWEYVVKILCKNLLWISYNNALNKDCQEPKCQRKKNREKKTWSRRLSVLNIFRRIPVLFLAKFLQGVSFKCWAVEIKISCKNTLQITCHKLHKWRCQRISVWTRKLPLYWNCSLCWI